MKGTHMHWPPDHLLFALLKCTWDKMIVKLEVFHAQIGILPEDFDHL